MSQPGFTVVSGTRIMDATGTLLSFGTITFTPVLSSGQRSAFQAGAPLYGQAGWGQVSALVTNGAFQITVADTTLTNPVNMAYAVEVLDATGNLVLGGPAYATIQPFGAYWSFDTFVPNIAPQLSYQLAVGPQGPTGSPGNFGPVVKTASQLGCVADGSTDWGPLLSSFFANASASAPRVLLLDIPPISVSTVTLASSGYCSIIGLGPQTGFTLLNGSNKPVISCGPWQDAFGGNKTPPARNASNILLRDFTIYGNREGQNQTYAGGPILGYVHGIDIWNCVGITIENVPVRDAAKYSIQISNCSDIKIKTSDCLPFPDNVTPVATNTDGVHFCGPVENWEIWGGRFRTGDDAIAINAPEGYGGDITNGLIVGPQMDLAFTAVRAYTTSGSAVFHVSDITIMGVRGQTQVLGFNFGLDAVQNCPTALALHRISVSDVRLACQRFALLQDNIGDISFSGCWWYGGIACAMVEGVTNKFNIEALSMTNCHICRDSNSNGQIAFFGAASQWKNQNNQAVTVRELDLSGCWIDDIGTSSLAPMQSAVILNAASTIYQLTAHNLDTYRVGQMLFPPAAWSQISGLASNCLLAMTAAGNDNLIAPGYLFNSSDGTSIKMHKLGGALVTFTAS